MRLAEPFWLLLLLLLPLVRALRARRAPDPSVRWPQLATLEAIAPGGARRRRAVLGALRTAVLVLCVVALARPQVGTATVEVHREGVDVVLAVDVSGSMLAEDFTVDGKRANRLDAVKDVVEEFVKARPDDRIGLVLFAGRPYTQCPLTLDHGWLLQNLGRAKIGMIEDGTAVGSALATAVNRLRASTAPSRFIVLLTDGQSNAGRITPQTAAEAAKALGIKVYTIGAGTRGMAPFPMQDPFGGTVYRPVQVDVDEPTLEAIAKETGGRYFRATDTESLREIYKEIDEAEKAPIKAPEHEERREAFAWLLWPALLLVVGEVVLGETRLRKLP